MKSRNAHRSGPDKPSPSAEQTASHGGPLPAEDGRNRRQTWLICLGLALAVLAAYGQLWDCDFVARDDGNYITANNMVKQGLSWRGIVWAFSTFYSSNWHPLTWISHQVDAQIYGMNPAGHHLTSLFLHLANSILLFLLLRRMTGAQWRSALAAALFALHPLHVESVAWISERKDVLSALFFILAVWAYTRFAEELKAGGPRARFFYAASLVLFALGLMAKAMLVTLPFVLILLDYWPLQRLRRSIGRCALEKIPFFILAAASSVVSFLAQRQSGTVMSLAEIPMGMRLANIPLSYARYVWKTLYPVHLAAYYPIQTHPPDWEVGVACLMLALVTIWAVWRVRAQPYLAVGWFWFLGMLAPVIGVVQLGSQSMADRYHYLPGIGLTIMIIWAAGDWLPRRAALWPAVLGWLAVAACMAATRLQAGYWTNSETLFRHALEITPGDGFLESSLGTALFFEGRRGEAMPHLRQGVAFAPRNPGVHYNLGNALLAQGNVPLAVEQFEIAFSLAPRDVLIQFTLGAALLKAGRTEDAIRQLEMVLQTLPNDADTHNELAIAFLRTGRAGEAADEYEKVLKVEPDSLRANANLAWILAGNPDSSLRNGARAVSLALRADHLSGGQDPFVIAALGAAYAEVGDFSKAAAAAQRALQFSGDESRAPLAAIVRGQLALYRAGSPFRDTTGLLAAAMEE
jgi:Flp pilus assembly protein TadD